MRRSLATCLITGTAVAGLSVVGLPATGMAATGTAVAACSTPKSIATLKDGTNSSAFSGQWRKCKVAGAFQYQIRGSVVHQSSNQRFATFIQFRKFRTTNPPSWRTKPALTFSFTTPNFPWTTLGTSTTGFQIRVCLGATPTRPGPVKKIV